MRTALRIDLGPLWAIVNRLKDPGLMQAINGIMGDKGVAALVSQAIAANFDEEGPGWKPLKARTIRSSVSASQKKKLAKLSSSELLERERLTRDWKNLSKEKMGRLSELNKQAGIKNSTPAGTNPSRRILQVTGLLRNSVTTVGAAHNIYRAEPGKLTWGTDLKYAGIHNRGGVLHDPGTKNGFGKGIKIPPHDIPIPKRCFLYLQEVFKTEIQVFVTAQARKLVMARLKSG